LFCDPSDASKSTAGNRRSIRELYTLLSLATADDLAGETKLQVVSLTEALEEPLPRGPDQAIGDKVLYKTESRTTLLCNTKEALDTGQDIHKYFMLRSLVARVLASETAYTLTAKPLLLVLLELQRHNTFAQERYKVYQAEKAAGVTGKWEISSNRLLRH
jgi:hypothetical protein